MQARLASIAPGAAAPAGRPATAAAAAAPAAAPPPAAAGTPSSGSSALADYRQLLGGQLAKVVDAAEAIGGQVLQASRVLAEGLRREAAVVEAMAACQVSRSKAAQAEEAQLPWPCRWPALGGQGASHQLARALQTGCRLPPPPAAAPQKPDDAALQQLVQPVGEQMMAAGDLAAGPRR